MSMLEQAIIDAKELREAAKANAEAEVIQKYSSQIKEAVDRLLEQDEEEGADVALDLDAAADDLAAHPELQDELPAAYDADVDDAKEEAKEIVDDIGGVLDQAQNLLDQVASKVAAIGEEDEDTVEIDLDKINFDDEAVDAAEVGMEAEQDSDVVVDELTEEKETTEEEIDISEEDLSAILERMVVDVSAQKSGWAGRPDSQIFFEDDLALARLESDGYKEKAKEYKEAVEKLTENVNKLQATLDKRNELIKNSAVLIESLQNKLTESHLHNVKLHFTNKALVDTSLNERQKNRIVEAINRADSTDKVKSVFETLVESVSSDPVKNTGPQNLTEVLKVRTLRARPTKTQTINESSEVLRLKKLAGIL
jgi:hypothetical protein